jgi:hypothetical protein
MARRRRLRLGRRVTQHAVHAGSLRDPSSFHACAADATGSSESITRAPTWSSTRRSAAWGPDRLRTRRCWRRRPARAVAERVAREGSRCAVDGVLENARDRRVVLRGRDQQRVGAFDLGSQPGDGGGRGLEVQVGVVGRERPEALELEQLGSRRQQVGRHPAAPSATRSRTRDGRSSSRARSRRGRASRAP